MSFVPTFTTTVVMGEERRSIVWDEPTVAELGRLWKSEGGSAGEIAKRWGVTRNTVLAKANRTFGPRGGGADTLKLGQRHSGRKGRAAQLQARPAGVDQRTRLSPKAAPPPRAATPDEAPVVPPKRFIDAAGTDCQWPFGEPGADMLVCGVPAADGRYCADHARRSRARK